jgi:hypothetical protein
LLFSPQITLPHAKALVSKQSECAPNSHLRLAFPVNPFRT